MKKLCGLLILVTLFVFTVNSFVLAEDKPTLKVAFFTEKEFEDGWMVEFDIAVMQELADRIGCNVEFVSEDEVDTCDCAIGNISVIDSDLVNCTIPYFNNDITLNFVGEEPLSVNASSVILTYENYELRNQLNDAIISFVDDETVYRLAESCGIANGFDTEYCRFDYSVRKDLLRAEIAEHMLSVKDVYFVSNDDYFLVLMQNGDLYLGESIDTQTPTLIEKNIRDVVVTMDNLNHKKRIQMLCNNGDVKAGKIHTISNISDRYEYEGVILHNVKEILNTNEEYVCLSISTSGVLQKYNSLSGETQKIIDNVKSCPVTRKDYLMVITNDDILYSLNYNSSASKYDAIEVMTNVKDATIDLILRNNNDLYQYRNVGNYYPGAPYEAPIRIGTNVGLSTDVNAFDNVVIDGLSHNIRYLTGSYERYQYSSGEVKKLNSHATNVHMPDNYNFWRFAGNTDEFYFDFDGNLCLNNIDSSYEVYLPDVKKVISAGHTAFFITNSGKLYAEDTNGSLSGFKAPFLTTFGQKNTKIYINSQEIKLSTNLQTVNDRKMYPFRECLEELGATVLWDDVNKIAIGEYENTTIEFPIGSNKYYINGVEYEMDVASYIDESIGRTYIPIRYAAEGLGFIVDWKDGLLENTISIYK